MNTKDKQPKRSVDEAITALWQVIDEARSFLADPKSTPADKKTWAAILGTTISILNKVLESQRGEKLGDEDIEEILKKLPERYAKIVTQIFKKQKFPKPDATATPATDDIYEQARALKYGEPILITWIDASRSQNVDATKLPIPNHNVETRKPDLPRIFVTVQKGDCYHDPHLVCIVDRTDNHSFEIESIPLVLIKRIEKQQTAKRGFETRKPEESELIFKHLKNSRQRQKGTVRFRDGSTKIFD